MTDMRVKLLLDFVKRGRAGKEARDELKGIKSEADKLKAAGGPDKLNRSLGDTSAKARKLAGDLAKAKAEAKALGATDARPRVTAYNRLKEMAQPKDRARDMLRGSAAGMMGASAGGLGISGMIKAGAVAGVATKSLSESLALERAMYDVSRATDASAEGLAGYRKEITSLSVATGQAAPELAGMLAQAGFAGRPKEELLAFMKYSAAAMTAWGTNAEQTGQSLAEIGNIYGANQKRIEEIGDAVNSVADASAAKETDLLNVLNRAGAAGRMIKVSAESTLALAGAMKEVGQAPEVIGTSLNALFQNLSLGDEATKEFSDGLKAIGTNSKKLQASVRKDAMGAIVDLLEKIKAVPDDLKRMQVLKQLFGREYADNIGALLNNLEGLKRLLEKMGDKKNYVGSVGADMEKKLQQDFNRLERGMAAVNEIARRAGEPLKVMAGAVGDGIARLLEAYNKAQEAKSKLDAAAKRIAAGDGTSEDADRLADDPDAMKKLTAANRQTARDRNQVDAEATDKMSEQASPDDAIRLQTAQERRNVLREISALEAEIASRGGRGVANQRQRLGQLKGQLTRLGPAQDGPEQIGPNLPSDEAKGRAADALEKKMAEDKRRTEADMARLNLLIDNAPEGQSREALVKRRQRYEHGPGEPQGPLTKEDMAKRVTSGDGPVPSKMPVPPRRPADLRAAYNVDLQPAGALMTEQIAAGIKSAQGQTDGAAQQIGDGVKGKLATVDAAAAGQQAMASFAQGITAGGQQAVAAARQVAAQVQSALNVKVAGLGAGSVRSKVGGALHDGVG